MTKLSSLIKIILTYFFTYSFLALAKPFTIMINPAGDAKDAGRMLHDSFERGVTLRFAQELKRNLENFYPNLRIVITRIPGETLEYLQNANFANRLNTDFYLSIHFYKESAVIPRIYIYHYLTDTFYVKPNINLFFYNFDLAHLININKTIEYAQKFKNVFSNSIYKNEFEFKGFYAIPFKPLVGIKSPALAIEIGLKNTNDFSVYTKIIIEAINQIIQ